MSVTQLLAVKDDTECRFIFVSWKRRVFCLSFVASASLKLLLSFIIFPWAWIYVRLGSSLSWSTDDKVKGYFIVSSQCNFYNYFLLYFFFQMVFFIFQSWHQHIRVIFSSAIGWSVPIWYGLSWTNLPWQTALWIICWRLYFEIQSIFLSVWDRIFKSVEMPFLIFFFFYVVR